MAQSVRVLDASVVLAALLGEVLEDEAEAWLVGGCISAVNVSEVVAKLVDLNFPADVIATNIAEARLDIRPFDDAQAERAGFLRKDTRNMGLSFGDRACLALAGGLDLPVVTADRAWAKLDLGIAVEVIR